ncbi:hypothetical protein MKX03_011376, partial [Papaver bracteatum]
YQKNFPENFIYEEGEDISANIGNNSQETTQGNERLDLITNVATSLRIYDSKIDRVDYLNRGSKRRRMDIEENTGKSSRGTENICMQEKDKASTIGVCAVGVIGDRRKTITADDLKVALKGKSVMDSEKVIK